jgi:hypothetical protein
MIAVLNSTYLCLGSGGYIRCHSPDLGVPTSFIKARYSVRCRACRTSFFRLGSMTCVLLPQALVRGPLDTEWLNIVQALLS